MINFFAKPMGALMKLMYDAFSFMDTKYISTYAIAIIVSTILLKLVLLPLTLKQTKSMKVMQDLNPKIKEIQQKYKNDPQTQQRKTMELYKEHNANPLSGCLPLLVQFPILIAFFYVLRDPVQYMFGDQVVFDVINKSFLWIKNLSLPANGLVTVNGVEVINGVTMGGLSLPLIGGALPVLAILAGVTTYFQTKMTQASQPPTTGNDQAKATSNIMTNIMPIMIFVFAINFPSGLALYWVFSNLFQLVQQIVVFNKSNDIQEVR